MSDSGHIFNIQHYSLQDGPGIRTTVFLKGCPLRCAWCHNPESQLATPELMVNSERCLLCHACGEVCPEGDGSLPDSPGSTCQLCGACVEVCPTGSRRLAGEEMSVNQALREILKDRLFFDESGGGVTFSGGEPLQQPQFLKNLLQACHAEGIHTAVDSCGHAPQTILEEVAEWTDLFLYDLKLLENEAHKKFTGASNEQILANLRRLHQIHRHIWIRIPLIPGVNDDPGHLRQMAGLIASLPGIRRVDLLPYHRNGAGKFQQLEGRFALNDTKSPSAESLDDTRALFQEHGINIHTYS